MKGCFKFFLILLLILVVAGVAVYLVLNQSKNSMTVNEFSDFMERNGYTIVNAETQIPDTDLVEDIYIAIDENKTHQIEFWKFTSGDSAMAFFEQNMNKFDAAKDENAIHTKISAKNYAKYTLTSGGKFMVVSRIDDTAIYLKVDEEYKDTLNELLKEMGY